MPAAYLETPNPRQRRAVEHGVEDRPTKPGAPVFVIAGVGSGTTNTLAHRVAYLIVNGADPRLYGIASLNEARAYLAHPLLGPRLELCTRTVLEIPNGSLHQIFSGRPMT